jgi:hypothetical protein
MKKERIIINNYSEGAIYLIGYSTAVFTTGSISTNTFS